MKLIALPQRIEIAFWRLAVKLMKMPNLKRISLIVLLISLGCTTGWVVSSQANILEKNGVNHPNQANFPGNPPTIVEGTLTAQASLNQSKILLIVVDQISKENEELGTAWLVSYVPERAKLAMLPLFPVSRTKSERTDREFTNSFSLDEDGQPSADFFKFLDAKKIRWDYYLVIDNKGLEKLSVVFGVNEFFEVTYSSVENLNLVQSNRESPQALLYQQTMLIRSFCQSSEETILTQDVLDILQKLQGNVATNLSEQWLVDEWLNLRRKNAGLSCEFPNLKISTSLP